jgi:hypothetical protein
MFISCARDLMNLLGSLVMSLSRLVARTIFFKTYIVLAVYKRIRRSSRSDKLI